jgi:hypothetical protein
MGRREMHTKFWAENLKGRYHSEDLDVDGKIKITMDLREIGREGVDWMHLAENSDHWRALVNTVMNLRF